MNNNEIKYRLPGVDKADESNIQAEKMVAEVKPIDPALLKTYFINKVSKNSRKEYAITDSEGKTVYQIKRTKFNLFTGAIYSFIKTIDNSIEEHRVSIFMTAKAYRKDGLRVSFGFDKMDIWKYLAKQDVTIAMSTNGYLLYKNKQQIASISPQFGFPPFNNDITKIKNVFIVLKNASNFKIECTDEDCKIVFICAFALSHIGSTMYHANY